MDLLDNANSYTLVTSEVINYPEFTPTCHVNAQAS